MCMNNFLLSVYVYNIGFGMYFAITLSVTSAVDTTFKLNVNILLDIDIFIGQFYQMIFVLFCFANFMLCFGFGAAATASLLYLYNSLTV